VNKTHKSLTQRQCEPRKIAIYPKKPLELWGGLTI
jgi:hypothetical protein